MAEIRIQVRVVPPVLTEATDAEVAKVADLSMRCLSKLPRRDQARVRKLLKLAHDTLKLTEN